MGPDLGELMDALNAQGITPTGPWFTHHLKMDPEIFDFEISVPVSAPVKHADRNATAISASPSKGRSLRN